MIRDLHAGLCNHPEAVVDLRVEWGPEARQRRVNPLRCPIERRDLLMELKRRDVLTEEVWEDFDELFELSLVEGEDHGQHRLVLLAESDATSLVAGVEVVELGQSLLDCRILPHLHDFLLNLCESLPLQLTPLWSWSVGIELLRRLWAWLLEKIEKY